MLKLVSSRRVAGTVAFFALSLSLFSSPADARSRHLSFFDRPRPNLPNLVALAQSAPELSILVQAVVRAGLVDELSAPGPLTVFAPTNDAFLALLASEGYPNLESVPLDALTDILLDHVVVGLNGSLRLSFLARSDGDLLPLGGLPLEFDRSPLEVNDIRIVSADLRASNGIVHVVDRVLLQPDPRPSITELAVSNPNLSILVDAAVRTGLDRILDAGAPFTVFAPTNAAFERLLAALDAEGLDDFDDRTLVNVLLDHVVANEIDPIDATGRRYFQAIGRLTLMLDLGAHRVNGVVITGQPIEAENGTVYVIEDVLIDR